MDKDWFEGWYRPARKSPSPHYNARPQREVSLLVIHNISLPAGCFGLPYIEQLFLGKLDCDADASFADLQGLAVSAHFLIRRDGELVQFVSCDDRAWHAGVSSFEGRTGCNDFAVGIELEGTDTSGFADAQYQQLQQLSRSLMACYPKIVKERIVGHSDIAPGRKTDPGEGFDWQRYLTAL
ncbi:1,6-anhydro-N-acetylmuramyl-L-alanine amidase AmpD [Shewanella fodinae]|uniref:1,6-anhydro-N-acetylmuramyl-L-alanine amidase AmpD n=1 Tax=Shewanella fodinae TaxID=552357 RepID=A0A4R2FK33_9GAMM|nr:1,6-anhydro-N-acetylmuramyl-L-alanine amidase AmpD [Shewanella fodinae]MCL2907746.1 1,6-anhydro-N-acetylmuramyl-L-alanine amidase AmpD [Shewanella fodinae]MDN5370135.1 N-acetyl-anhydromuramoyl-L-alanine amidase [Shewanella sp.]TCN90779.1 N-acetylmuramyl-L-alanine amidase AmpD (negative regulator of AmpC) [Shewanella fodinae]GGZ10011.1 N-acetyl-anhydromuranmyl-L-alanine amidase [Shewanella fodinae]